MFVKLQWTQDKHISQIFKLITYIVNTPAVATVSDLTTALTDAAVFNSQASVYAGWDPTNSYIYRTGTGNNALTTAKTIARFGKFNANVYGWNFFLEQTAYDNSNHKTVYGLNSYSNTLTAGNIFAAHRQSTNGSLITYIGNEATTTNNLNSAATSATGFVAAGVGNGTLVPITITSTAVTTNTITISTASAAPIQVCKGMRLIVTGTTYGGLAAGTYTVLLAGSANTFTVTAGDYNGVTSNASPTLTTYSGPYTGATYALEVAAHTDSIWTNALNTTKQIGASTMENQVRTAWFYITDNCFLWSLANSTGGTTGLPAGANLQSTSNHLGPYFQAQYTRTDPWNTAANGIIPWIRTNHNRITVGTSFGSRTSDFESVYNVMATDAFPVLPIVADTIVDARPTTTATSWQKLYYYTVNLGAGPKYNEFGGLNTGGTGGNAGTTATVPGTGTSTSYPILQAAAGVRWWSNDLTKKTYMMLPITWRHNPYNVSGGNITDRTGIYWFNGDYFPGDTLTFNSKTYVLMPLGLCQNDVYRVAFAIPRE